MATRKEAGMRYATELVPARLIRRYKRFLVDARLEDGRMVTAHTNNTGAMRGCLVEGARIWLRPDDAPHRKLPYTFTLIRVGQANVCVDTSLAVPMVQRALGGSLLPELAGYPRVRREVRYGAEGRSRIDLLLARDAHTPGRTLPDGEERVYLEVKSTTLVTERCAAFPDAVTTRGQKHLEELMHVVRSGQRAAMVYGVMRKDADVFRPADAIDPRYGALLREACRVGVEAYALSASVGSRRLRALRRLPIQL